jgi:hypothetical protein
MKEPSLMNEALVKGTGINYFNDILSKQSPSRLEAFLSLLTPEEQSAFKKVLPISWVPIELASKYYTACAATLFPKDPQDIEKLASQVAGRDLGGIYRVLLKIVSMNTMIQQAAKLWKVNHQKGLAKAWTIPDQKTSILEVTDYPELTPCYSRVTRGYMMGMTALTGSKTIAVKIEQPSLGTWRWVATWI